MALSALRDRILRHIRSGRGVAKNFKFEEVFCCNAGKRQIRYDMLCLRAREN